MILSNIRSFFFSLPQTPIHDPCIGTETAMFTSTLVYTYPYTAHHRVNIHDQTIRGSSRSPIPIPCPIVKYIFTSQDRQYASAPHSPYFPHTQPDFMPSPISSPSALFEPFHTISGDDDDAKY